MAAPLADEGVVPTLGGPPVWQHRGTPSALRGRCHPHWDGRVSSRCEAAWSTSQLKALRAASHSPRPAMPSTCRCASWMWCSAKSTLPPAAARACRHSRSLVPGRRSRRAATASALGSRTAGSSTGSRTSSSFSRHDQQGGTTAGLTRKGRTWGMGQAGLGATSRRKKGFPPLREIEGRFLTSSTFVCFKNIACPQENFQCFLCRRNKPCVAECSFSAQT
ncbi:unnamed protein product [Ixodes persulcatus]